MKKKLNIDNLYQLYEKFDIEKKLTSKIIKKLVKLYDNSKINNSGIKYISNIFLIIYLYKFENLDMTLNLLDDFYTLDNILKDELISFINSLNINNVIEINTKLLDNCIFSTISFFYEVNDNKLVFSLLNEIIICTRKIKKINDNIKIMLFLQYSKQVRKYIKNKKVNSSKIYMNTIETFNKLTCNLNDWLE